MSAEAEIANAGNKVKTYRHSLFDIKVKNTKTQMNQTKTNLSSRFRLQTNIPKPAKPTM
jgi:hypothetical protein